MIASLTSDLEHVMAQLARAEKTGKAAEVNLSLQNAQHRRETSELQKQLTALQSQPDLAGVIADLEERNNEMEELLKNKCAEIEENDDRALEYAQSPRYFVCSLIITRQNA
jgi:myosin protein heavy chain